MREGDPPDETVGRAEADELHREMPAWVPAAIRFGSKRLIAALVAAAFIVIFGQLLLGKLSGLLTTLMISLFLSFALEPAVGWLASHGWRRGWATGVLFLALLGMFVLIVALIVPAIVSGFNQLIDNAPELVARAARWLDLVGIHISQENVVEQIQQNAQDIGKYGANIAGGLLALTSSLVGALFQWATIALFTFYFVAEGPRVRRTVCSLLPRERQEHVLFIWERAIEHTGGYFYSRLLLAFINGIGMYVTLRVVEVPFAAPLAVFEGVVAAFIPIVGTYIGGAAPVLVAFLTSTTAGIASLAYIVIYQQLENYILSPRITAKTMSLHPAVAFAAALVGAALGGLLMAFLALPTAAVIQSAAKEWGQRYDVVETDLTAEEGSGSTTAKPGFLHRLRKGMADDEDAPPGAGPSSPADGS
jgi:predicted PurR-regulated permease PerM